MKAKLHSCVWQVFVAAVVVAILEAPAMASLQLLLPL